MKKNNRKIAIIVGTRPEIIKMSPIIKECQKKKINFFVIHTHQHYSENMDLLFFREINLPTPKYNLITGSGTHAQATATMLTSIEKILIKEEPKIVLIEGDTNTVLAGALAAVKLHIKIGHVEAGLRSFFKEMPEEINRVLTDHCSDYFFAPTLKAKKNLLKEGISEKKIFITGNTIVDVLKKEIKIAAKSDILKRFLIKKNNYFVLTMHREENVDNKKTLKKILQGIDLIYKTFKLPIIYPIHPRTKKRLEYFKIDLPSGILKTPPLGYLDFLKLEENARLILTDSGGIQEEACILKVPCVTLRNNTERSETIEIGANILAGTESKKILTAAKIILSKTREWPNPFGNGRAAQKIIKIIKNHVL